MTKIIGLLIVVSPWIAILSGKLDFNSPFTTMAIIIMAAAVGLWITSHPTMK